MAEQDPLHLEVRDAVVDALLATAMARTLRELEVAAQKAIDRGGGGVAPSRLRQLTRDVLVGLEDAGHLRKNPGASPSYELTPSGRAKFMF